MDSKKSLSALLSYQNEKYVYIKIYIKFIFYINILSV